MSDTTRREILFWGVAAVGAAAVGAGIALARGGRPAAGVRQAAAAPESGRWLEDDGWELPFSKPTALVAQAGGLAVAGDRGLCWYTPAGAVQRRQDLASDVRALAVDAAGHLWLARMGAVEGLGADGTAARALALPDGCLPGGLAAFPDAVWVSDCATRRVLRLHTDQDIRPLDCEPFVIPSPWFPMAAGSDGLVWVSNTGHHRLEGYDRDGRLVRRWGRPGADAAGFCGCCNPAFVAVLPDGRYVTAEKGQPRVKLHAADGGLLDLVAGPARFHPDTVGLAAAPLPDGRLAVLDPHARRIRIFRAPA